MEQLNLSKRAVGHRAGQTAAPASFPRLEAGRERTMGTQDTLKCYRASLKIIRK